MLSHGGVPHVFMTITTPTSFMSATRGSRPAERSFSRQQDAWAKPVEPKGKG